MSGHISLLWFPSLKDFCGQKINELKDLRRPEWDDPLARMAPTEHKKESHLCMLTYVHGQRKESEFIH
jgi:hypothetical protein